jgi:hypothetical protein
MTLGAIAAALGLIIDAIVVWSKSIEPMKSILKNLRQYYYKSNSLSLSSHGRFELYNDCYFSSFALMSGVVVLISKYLLIR